MVHFSIKIGIICLWSSSAQATSSATCSDAADRGDRMMTNPFAIADSRLHRPVPILTDRNVELVDPDVHSRGLQVLSKAQRKSLVAARIANEISRHHNCRISNRPANFSVEQSIGSLRLLSYVSIGQRCRHRRNTPARDVIAQVDHVCD